MSRRKHDENTETTELNGKTDPEQASRAPTETHLENGVSDWSDEEKAKHDESQIIWVVSNLDAGRRRMYADAYAKAKEIDPEGTGSYGAWLLQNHRGELDAWRGVKDAERASA